MSLTVRGNLQLRERTPVHEPAPVFVDTTGRRRTRAQVALAAGALACGGYVAALGFGFTGGPVGLGNLPPFKAASDTRTTPGAVTRGPAAQPGAQGPARPGTGGAAPGQGVPGSNGAPAGQGAAPGSSTVPWANPTSVPGLPGAAAPGTTAPGTTAPGTTAPGTTAPGTTAPGTTAPTGATTPGTTTPADGAAGGGQGSGSTPGSAGTSAGEAAKAAAKAAREAARVAKKAPPKAAEAVTEGAAAATSGLLPDTGSGTS